MKVLRVIATVVLAGLLVLGFVANNLWRWLEEFHTLDSIAGFSVYLQVCLLLLALFSLFMTFRGKRLIHWIPFVLASLVAVTSWYSVRLSDSENAFFYGVFPFSETRIHFSEVSAIRFESQSIVIKPAGTVMPMPSAILGFDKATVVNALRSYGECLEEGGQTGCVEINLVWP